MTWFRSWTAAVAVFAGHRTPTYARLARRAAIAGFDDLDPLITLAGLRLAAWDGRARDPFAGDEGALVADLTALRGEFAEASADGLLQFNEPQRLTDVLPGLLLTAQQYPGRPIHLVELGAGAGFSLLADRVVVDYATGRRPGREVDLCLTSDLAVPPGLLTVDLPIASAVGIDRRPLDMRDATDVRVLRAFSWPDLPARQDRIDAAAAAAATAPPHLVRGDVLDIGPDVLADLVGLDAVTVVVDSGFAAHLAPTDRDRLDSLLRVAARSGVVTTISREPAERPSGWRLSAMRFRDLTTGRLITYCVGDLVSERVAWVGPR